MHPTRCATLLPLVLAACATPIPDRALGLSRAGVLETTEPAAWSYPVRSPGGNELAPRAFPASPPVLPHDVKRSITRADNGCLKCHDVGATRSAEELPLPESHRIDLRHAPGVTQPAVVGARWFCLSCHVAQAEVTPPVGSTF